MWVHRLAKDAQVKAAGYNGACVRVLSGRHQIAIGLGARVGRGRQKKDGAFLILNEKDLVILHEGRDSKQWIGDIKFSPDGNTLGLGSNDNMLYLYDIGGGYVLKGDM